jgi:hypothetical protein
MFGMRNATKWRLWERRNRRTFALDKSRAKMLTLSRAQTSLTLLSLNRIIAPLKSK